MFSFFNNSNGERSVNNLQERGADNFETLQNARKDLVGEIDAIIQYDYHLHETTNKLAKETWESIKNEELTHVGELLAMLNYLDPSQKQYVEAGIKEFNERMKNN